MVPKTHSEAALMFQLKPQLYIYILVYQTSTHHQSQLLVEGRSSRHNEPWNLKHDNSMGVRKASVGLQTLSKQLVVWL